MYPPPAAVHGYVWPSMLTVGCNSSGIFIFGGRPRTSRDTIQHLKHKPIRVACEVVRAKTKTRAGYLVAAWPPAHPWTRPPCYGGQDQDGQGRKEARVDDRAYPLSLIAAAGG